MKGDRQVIQFLNKALRQELTAINQYFLHARMYKNWGLKKLDEHEYHESIDEMKHADRLIERILFLAGLPNLQDIGSLRIGENPKEMIECDLALEMEAAPILREAITHCESVQDYISRELFEDILESEEEHIDWLETQLDLIARVGLENYLQSHMQRDRAMYVCICNAVTEREIARAIERGAHTLAQLTETLGVGTGCGKCLDAAASFLASHPPPAAVAEPPA